MGVRIPGGKKPSANVAAPQLNKIAENIILTPFAWLLSVLLGGSMQDWDTLEEIADNIVPAIIKRVLGPFGVLMGGGNPSEIDSSTKNSLLSNIPIIGDIAQAITGIAGGAMSTIQGFMSGLTKAASGQNPGSGTGITGILGQIFGFQAATANTATAAASAAAQAKSAISTGANGAIVSQGVLDGLTYQLQVFTSNGTFTPPMPPAGKEIAYYIGTVYGGGASGDRVGVVTNTTGRGGRPARRIPVRITVGEMGASQAVTVGAGGAPTTTTGPGNAGSASSIGSLLRSDSGATGAPGPYGDLGSSGDPAEGGRGGMRYVIDGSGSSPLYGYTEGQRGEDGGGNGGEGGAMASGWFGSARSPQPGADGRIVGDHTTGGGGGGGGGSGGGTAQSGASGGVPGGGGGAAGSGNANGGPGGRGQVDILTVFKDIAA